MPYQALPRRNVPIRRDKSARVGVVVAGIQVVERGLGIVVVPAVAEGVVGSGVVGGTVDRTADGLLRAVAPRVVGVGQQFGAYLVVDRDHVPLQIGLKEEQIVGPCGVRTAVVCHPDGRTACVVQVEQQVAVPRLG